MKKSKNHKKAHDRFDRRLLRLEARVADFVSKSYEGDGTKEWRASLDKLADGVIVALSKCTLSIHTLPKRDFSKPEKHYHNWPMPHPSEDTPLSG
jgi:hypothetical protein